MAVIVLEKGEERGPEEGEETRHAAIWDSSPHLPEGRQGRVIRTRRQREYKTKHKEQGKKIPKALRIQVQEEAKSMYPTPNARDWKDTVNTVPPSVNKTRGYSLGMKVAQEKVAQTMYPTPTNSEHKYRLKGNSQASKCLEAQSRRAGGRLNPNFVEFLMGYPMNWTKIEPTESKHLETQSCHKSQNKS